MPRLRLATTVTILLMVAACADDPLGAVGRRASDWITEPTVVTTTTVAVTIPTVMATQLAEWANDDIVSENLDDPSALISEIFARREGDRFIQASRAEIMTALPGVSFPALVPHEGRWISSQLVVDSDGTLSREPSAAFGIWSAEPYTRSRSVAQMAVLTVSIDEEGAEEVAGSDDPLSCARFADLTTELCDLLSINGRQIWKLGSTAGTTLIWFEDTYRYELLARGLVPDEILERMASESVPLSELGSAPT